MSQTPVMKICEILKDDYQYSTTEQLKVNGWIKTCRDQKAIIFIAICDGSSQKTLQIVCDSKIIDNFDEVKQLTTGSSISVIGKLVQSPAKGQTLELIAEKISIYQKCPSTFPIQKTGLSLDFLRTLPHLRHRTNMIGAVFSVKSVIMKSIHDYFMERKFKYVDLPILTTNACEGGCQPLQVTSLLNDIEVDQIPTIKIEQKDSKGQVISSEPSKKIDYKKDFFDTAVYLTVSNQLHLECFAHGLGAVYTITPASRGEPTQTTKHLATFSMLEYEFCFCDLSDNIDLSEGLIKYCAYMVLENCKAEIELLDIHAEKKLISKLQALVLEPFIRISHRDVIKLLTEIHQVTPFDELPGFSDDISGEHERFLVKHFGKPVVVMKYPKKVKSFYMPVCERVTEEDGSITEYVDCFDLLTDIGETVGGSQRIWHEKELVDRMTELGIDTEHLDWYVQLRRYGSVPHGGVGVGIERLVACLTGISNVKDCTAFPITIHHCTY